MPDSSFAQVIDDVAKDLRVDKSELRKQFFAWRNQPWPHAQTPPEWAGACYAVYRLSKLTWALRVTKKSRDRWRDRAIALGSPPDLTTPIETAKV